MRRAGNEFGFTLIELLTVVAIIGLLAAIAIPQYAQYRTKGFDAIAQVDLRTVAVAEEAYYADSVAYLTCDQSSCPTLLPNLDQLSPGVALSMVSTGDTFTGSANHTKGSGRVFSWPP